MVKEKPILFSTPMVQAIMNDGKAQTRRIVKPQPIYHPEWGTTGYEYKKMIFTASGFMEKMIERSPYQVGNKLWVRETWADIGLNGMNVIVYKADINNKAEWKWKPSIFMPKKYCRLWLEITNVRAEKLQDIEYDDIVDEGIDQFWEQDENEYGGCWHIGKIYTDSISEAWQLLWDSINAKRGYGWDTNPWVRAVSFKRI